MICTVVGARPNFVKMSPIVLELRHRGIPQILVHTGQHYDETMSKVFFHELGMPKPDIHLGVGSETHARQTARILIEFEDVCRRYKPQMILVAGDVNSTLAAALVAAKECIPVAHIEAGLRSFDRAMPEEVNRIITDHLSDLLFTTEESAYQNLQREGIPEEKIHFVGNCMIDSLMKHKEAAIARAPWTEFGLETGKYGLLTLHRPSNVDCLETLTELFESINIISERLPILFPVHPRTRDRICRYNIAISPGVRLCDPLPYLSFLGLMARARLVLTDSGGIQEETTALGVPCLTLRQNTERPATITCGSNRLVGTSAVEVIRAAEQALAGEGNTGRLPSLWDGRASQRIVDVLERWCVGASVETRHTAGWRMHKMAVKRSLDLAISAAGLLLLAPLFLVVGLATILDDGFPVFFRQKRVGRNGRPFDILKLRSMRTGIAGSPITAADDPRVTRVGRWLRRYKLDELPQLWNVFRGEMSLVGPRPEIPKYVDLRNPAWRHVLAVAPGITDIATLVYRNEEDVLNGAADLDDYYRHTVLPAKLTLNIEYLSQRSLWLDLRIIATTVTYSFLPGYADADHALELLR